MLIRRVWLGDPPVEAFDRQVDVYRSYTPAAAQQHWRDNGFLCRDDPARSSTSCAAAYREAGADVLNLRVHVAGGVAGTGAASRSPGSAWRCCPSCGRASGCDHGRASATTSSSARRGSVSRSPKRSRSCVMR